jgi:hypothetical protein
VVHKKPTLVAGRLRLITRYFLINDHYILQHKDQIFLSNQFVSAFIVGNFKIPAHARCHKNATSYQKPAAYSTIKMNQ